jgi:hypothetical protein
VLHGESLDVLTAQQVMAGASYEVEVTASDAAHRSAPLRTPPLVTERGSKGTMGFPASRPNRRGDDKKALPRKQAPGQKGVDSQRPATQKAITKPQGAAK